MSVNKKDCMFGGQECSTCTEYCVYNLSPDINLDDAENCEYPEEGYDG